METRLNKEEGSQDPGSYESQETGRNIQSLADQKGSKSLIEKLRLIPSKRLAEIVDKRIQLALLAQTAEAEKVAKVGIYRFDGKTTFVAPEDFFTEDNMVGMVIASAAQFSGAEVRVTQSASGTLTQMFDADFLRGIWDGMYSTTNLLRRRGKQGYELGRTAMFCMIVRKYFETHPQLGSEALYKDNFFFGNNPGELSGKVSIRYAVRAKMISFFEDPEVGNLFYGILNHAAEWIGLSNLSPDERDKVIAAHIIPIEAVITSCYPQVSQKRGRKEVIKNKRPNPIKNSPLFLPEEMRLISLTTSGLFTELSGWTSHYLDSVMYYGYRVLKTHISRTISARWECLARFAHLTKKRLQVIRTIIRNPTIKKAQVVRDHVVEYLKCVSSPVESLVKEIEHTVGHTILHESVSYGFKKSLSAKTVKPFLLTEAQNAYVGILGAEKLTGVKVPKLGDVRDVEFAEILTDLLLLQTRISGWTQHARNLEKIRYVKLFGRTEHLIQLIRGIRQSLDRVMGTDTSVLTTTIRLFSQDTYRDGRELLEATTTRLEKDIKSIVRTIGMRSKEETSPELRKVLADFLEKLRQEVTGNLFGGAKIPFPE